MPGGVSISKSVHDMIVGKTELTFKNQGLQRVKQNGFMSTMLSLIQHKQEH